MDLPVGFPGWPWMGLLLLERLRRTLASRQGGAMTRARCS
jgi:hypothetical protein